MEPEKLSADPVILLLAKATRDPETGCWHYRPELRGTYGYSQFRGEGAHRVGYRLLVGEIPEGRQLDHLCRERRCINPAHLEPVTRRENILRGISFSARHAVATHCVQGHPFDEANTFRRADRGGSRVCRTCGRLAQRAYKQRKRQNVP